MSSLQWRILVALGSIGVIHTIGAGICQERFDSRPTVEILSVVGAKDLEVVVRVTNLSPVAISLISPDAPSVVVQQGECSFLLSTDVAKRLKPFDFAPEFVGVDATASRSFTIRIAAKRLLRKGCQDWKVDVEMTYLIDADAKQLRELPRKKWLQFVTTRQQVIVRAPSTFKRAL